MVPRNYRILTFTLMKTWVIAVLCKDRVRPHLAVYFIVQLAQSKNCKNILELCSSLFSVMPYSSSFSAVSDIFSFNGKKYKNLNTSQKIQEDIISYLDINAVIHITKETLFEG